MNRRIFTFILIIFVSTVLSADAFGKTVTARSVSSGMYEDGVYTSREDGFACTYIIDEAAGTVKVGRIIENNREGKADEGEIFEITNIVVSEGISALLVSRNKKGQKIITAVREAGLGATDVLIIGKDFYEYCRASNGRFYLEYGEVTGAGGE